MKPFGFKKNAIHNILGWVLPAGIFIILTRLIINKLGTEAFGIVSFIQVVTGYLNILNFGFSETIIKQVAENLHKDPDRIARILWVGLALFAGIGLLGGLVLIVLSDWVGTTVLNVSPGLRADTVMALRIGGIINVLQMIAEFYRGSALGCNRFDIPNICRTFRILVSGIITVYFLENGGGIVSVLSASLIGLSMGLLLNGAWMQKVLPVRWVSGSCYEVWLEVFHFSKHMLIVRFAGMLSNRINQLLLGILKPIANVAFYQVPVTSAETGVGILNKALEVLYPHFASLDKTDRQVKETIASMVKSILTIQILATLPIFLVIILEGSRLIALWINSEFSSNTSHILTIISISYFISSLTGIFSYVAMSFNSPSILSKYAIYQLGVALIAGCPLVYLYALEGAAWTLLFCSSLSLFFVQETCKTLLGFNAFSAFIRIIIGSCAIAIPLYLTYNFVYRYSTFYTPYASLVAGFFYFLMALYLPLVTRNDRSKLLRLLLKLN